MSVENDGVTENEDGSVTFRAGGESYTLPANTDEQQAADYLAIDRKIRSERRGPIEAILPEMDKLKAFPEMQKTMVDKAYEDLKRGDSERSISTTDIRLWLDTFPGILFSVGLAFRRVYPEINDAKLMGILRRVGGAQLQKLRDKAIATGEKLLAKTGDDVLLAARDHLSSKAIEAIMGEPGGA